MGASAGCWQQDPDFSHPSSALWAKPATLQDGVREKVLKSAFTITWSIRTTQNWLVEQQRVHAFAPNGLGNPVPTQDSAGYGHNMFILWEQTCSVLEDFLQATVVLI